jgi:hypothetical protein
MNWHATFIVLFIGSALTSLGTCFFAFIDYLDDGKDWAWLMRTGVVLFFASALLAGLVWS